MADEIVKSDGLGIQQLISEGLKNNASIDVMERLFALSKESMAIKARQEFYLALSKFQNEIPKIIKNKPVKSKAGNVVYHYAPLEEIVEQVKASLESNGFSYTLKTKQENNSITVFCEAHHISGHTDTTDITVPIGSDYMSAQQQVGAALTFAKRYAFCDAFGIMTGDEDTDAVATEEQKKAETAKTEEKPRIVCPVCGKEAIIKGKVEYGGGYLCYSKKGGCGAKFADDDVRITGKEPVKEEVKTEEKTKEKTAEEKAEELKVLRLKHLDHFKLYETLTKVQKDLLREVYMVKNMYNFCEIPLSEINDFLSTNQK